MRILSLQHISPALSIICAEELFSCAQDQILDLHNDRTNFIQMCGAEADIDVGMERCVKKGSMTNGWNDWPHHSGVKGVELYASAMLVFRYLKNGGIYVARGR